MQSLPAATSLAPRSVQKFPLRGIGTASLVKPGAVAVAVIDALGFFVFFMSRSPWLAGAFASVNAVLLLLFLRFHLATRHSSLVVDSNGVDIRLAAIRVRIPRSNIRSVEATLEGPVPERAPDYLSFVEDDAPNLLITLTSPTSVRLARGVTRTVTRIGVSVNDTNAAIAALSRPSPVPAQ